MFAVTTAEGLAIFQARLKLAREEARAQIANRNNKFLISHGSDHLC